MLRNVSLWTASFVLDCKVAVKNYVQKKGINLPANRYEYKYSLWLPQMGHVQTVSCGTTTRLRLFLPTWRNWEHHLRAVSILLLSYVGLVPVQCAVANDV